MNITYDTEKLKGIIDDLASLTGLAVAIVDTEYEYIYVNKAENFSYCSMIQKTDIGYEGCVFCDKMMLRGAEENKLPFTHNCHAGLRDTTVPIFKGDVIAGYIILGRERRERELSPEIIERVSGYGIPRDKILAEYSRVTEFTAKQHASLVRLVSHILFEGAIEIDYDEFINKATEYISANVSGDLSVKNLCSKLYVSKNYLYEAFRNYLGKTVNEYITDERIKLACEYLEQKKMRAAEVAAAVGIENYPYFSKLFKKKTGVSPSKFKNQKSFK